ncbi:MAG: hypothetical protein R3F20_02080 [Planctomycetota bacterium]
MRWSRVLKGFFFLLSLASIFVLPRHLYLPYCAVLAVFFLLMIVAVDLAAIARRAWKLARAKRAAAHRRGADV